MLCRSAEVISSAGSYRWSVELHQWGDVGLLQLVEDQTRRPFLDHLERQQTGAHIGAPVRGAPADGWRAG